MQPVAGADEGALIGQRPGGDQRGSVILDRVRLGSIGRAAGGSRARIMLAHGDTAADVGLERL